MNDVIPREGTRAASFTTEDIIAATGGEILSSGPDSFAGVSIDSRTIRAGELFIALRGERFDGHEFLPDALRKGNGAIIHSGDARGVPGKTVVRVPDTLKALQDIARFHRARHAIAVVGVTGSNGKTTTKELIASILAARFRVLRNEGNLNNQIGLPLTLTKMEAGHEAVVLEMGASAPGDIRDLCRIAKPDYGVLTNIGRAHLEGFGDMETVRETKLELLETVQVAVANADDLFLMEGIRRAGFRRALVRYGNEATADVRAVDPRVSEDGLAFGIRFPDRRTIDVNARLAGLFNVSNILAAASVGYLFGVDPLLMKSAIELFAGVSRRMEIKEYRGMKVICDVYNANPSSMHAALVELARMRKGRAIAVLGDMLELGAYEEEAHRDIGRALSALAVDVLIAAGRRMASAVSEFNGTAYRCERAEEAGAILREVGREGDTVLIKGSRGMQMERVLEE